MKTVAVLLAAGRSERFGEDKLWVNLNGAPLWRRSYKTLESCPVIDSVGIVCQPGREADYRALAPSALFIVEGGASRTESARNGFEAVPPDTGAVLFHDAARPFVDHQTIERVVDAVRSSGAAFPSIPVTDTVKQRNEDGYRTLHRESLVAVQTPQGATYESFRKAFGSGIEATDDMALLEAIGVPQRAVKGDPRNFKVTNRSDLVNTMQETRTGLGYDVHRFSEDPAREMWLGGVQFEPPGLVGHSDADAVLHAVVDALLGAVSLGDIGEHFQNTDPRWKDAPSSLFLKESVALVTKNGWDVVNIDVSVIAERPRLAEKRDEIRSVIAGLVGISPDQVGVKATTNEGLGAIGRGEGVAAFAVATVRRDV